MTQNDGERSAGSASEKTSERRFLLDRNPRLAAAVFGAYVIVGFFVIMLVVGDERWFLGDEWTFLAGRDTGSLGDYFRPLNGHWTTLPLLLWRGLFEVFGLHSYVPYQVPVVALHLTAACLLRMIMRRSGVSPWMATVAAGSFVLLGTGESNIVWGFQVTLVGSLVLGLAQMILADHDGGLGRRDYVALVCGAAALMSSGIGVVMAVAVGASVLIRRGWRMAVVQVLPLAVLFGIWTLAYRPSNIHLVEGKGALGAAAGVLDFMWDGLVGVFDALGQYAIVGLALAVGTVVGLAMVCVRRGWSGMSRTANLPLGLLAGLVASLFTTGVSRSGFLVTDIARSDRYLHVFVALALPAIALAADSLARHWRPLAPLAIALFVVGIPGNVNAFERSIFGPQYFSELEALIVGIAASEEAREAPPHVQPEPNFVRDVSIGWLVRMNDEGKLPEAPPADEATAAEYRLRLGMSFEVEPIPDSFECEVRDRPFKLKLDRGDQFGIPDEVTIVLLEGGEPAAPGIGFNPFWTGALGTAEDEIVVRFAPGFGQTEYELCVPPE